MCESCAAQPLYALLRQQTAALTYGKAGRVDCAVLIDGPGTGQLAGQAAIEAEVSIARLQAQRACPRKSRLPADTAWVEQAVQAAWANLPAAAKPCLSVQLVGSPPLSELYANKGGQAWLDNGQ